MDQKPRNFDRKADVLMSKALFLEDSYRKTASARVMEITPDGEIILDECLFYATSGGQPSDTGVLKYEGRAVPILECKKGEEGAMLLVPEVCDHGIPVGASVEQEIDFERRYKHMRMHTALHLLSVVIPLPVTGGAITAEKGRLDFDMPEAPEDKEALSHQLNHLIQSDLSVSEQWITQEELDEQPELVKTLSVKPPRGSGLIRLVRIGTAQSQTDFQPCGGTHVNRVSEIGPMRVSKIEKKGRQNRRVHIVFD